MTDQKTRPSPLAVSNAIAKHINFVSFRRWFLALTIPYVVILSVFRATLKNRFGVHGGTLIVSAGFLGIFFVLLVRFVVPALRRVNAENHSD